MCVQVPVEAKSIGSPGGCEPYLMWVLETDGWMLWKSSKIS